MKLCLDDERYKECKWINHHIGCCLRSQRSRARRDGRCGIYVKWIK
jgi:hypothetical protein